MRVPQKWQYALRGVFELARRANGRPVKVSDIADAQAIPPRFLEVILNQLKRHGIVDSRRGNEGGYFLVRSPHNLTVGDVMRSLTGAVAPIRCRSADNRKGCPLYDDCVFLSMWEEASKAMWAVYDTRTFQELLEEADRKKSDYVPSYCI